MSGIVCTGSERIIIVVISALRPVREINPLPGTGNEPPGTGNDPRYGKRTPRYDYETI